MLVEAWAGTKDCRRQGEESKEAREPDSAGSGRRPRVNFRGERWGNDTHRPMTDPQARMFRKGKGMELKLSFLGLVLDGSDRDGLAVARRVSRSRESQERESRSE